MTKWIKNLPKMDYRFTLHRLWTILLSIHLANGKCFMNKMYQVFDNFMKKFGH